MAPSRTTISTLTAASTANMAAADASDQAAGSDAAAQLLCGAQNITSPLLPAAPLKLIELPPPHDLSTNISLPIKVVAVPKLVTEYPLPGARQTHEMAVVGENMLVISQQTNSTLLKVQLHRITGRPISCAAFVMGGFWAGLHGLATSQNYPGWTWATLQFKSLLLLIDVGANHATAPRVVQVINIPSPAQGPHCVLEYGPDVWVSCKDSSHVVRISQTNPSTDFSVYPCSAHPIFIAIHPTSGDTYASLDVSSKIWRLNVTTGETSEIDIPSSYGSTPVGLVGGPDGNVWFTLVGGASGGTGTFARITATAEFEWFSLTTPIGKKAGLLHLGFDWDDHLKQTAKLESNDGDGATGSPTTLRLWLLGSSLVADKGNGIDAVFTVLIDSQLGRITTQHSIVLPTQECANHRVLPHRTGLFVTQLSVSSLAHIAGAAALNPADVVGETVDFYSDFGLGKTQSQYVFSQEYCASHGKLLGLPFDEDAGALELKASASAGRPAKRLRSMTNPGSTK